MSLRLLCYQPRVVNCMQRDLEEADRADHDSGQEQSTHVAVFSESFGTPGLSEETNMSLVSVTKLDITLLSRPRAGTDTSERTRKSPRIYRYHN